VHTQHDTTRGGLRLSESRRNVAHPVTRTGRAPYRRTIDPGRSNDGA
jgi:hypothetical protein